VMLLAEDVTLEHRLPLDVAARTARPVPGHVRTIVYGTPVMYIIC
jgi:hypothetical protein